MSTAIQYPYLPPNHTISYVSEANEFMQAAKVAATKAADKQHSTGAVVVKAGQIVGEGFNYAVIAAIPGLIQSHPKWCIRKHFNVPSGQKYWACPGCIPSKNHAEGRAVRAAGEKARGADLYLWGHWWCCQPCWEAMIGAGINNVYLLEGSEVVFNKDNPNNRIGKQFE